MKLKKHVTLEPSTRASATADDRSAAFRAVDNNKESVAGGPLLIAAYAILWMIVLFLVVRIFRRQNTIAMTIEKLESSINHTAKMPLKNDDH